ncbi:MAG TPA: HAD hydrolase-like protein [Longimicrobium sp.]
MKYRLAIFDFDGTLADSFPWFLQVLNEAADTFGFLRASDVADYDTLRGLHARDIGRRLQVPAWKQPLVARWMRRRMARDIGTISLFPGAGEMLHRLDAAGVTIAIVSSNSAANIRRVLGPANAGLVRFYGCGASLFGKRVKLRKVLRDSAITAAEALCVGDEVRDLEAAHAEGIAFGAVAWGYTHADALAAHSPAEMFTRVEEIAERLADLRASAA